MAMFTQRMFIVHPPLTIEPNNYKFSIFIVDVTCDVHIISIFFSSKWQEYIHYSIGKNSTEKKLTEFNNNHP